VIANFNAIMPRKQRETKLDYKFPLNPCFFIKQGFFVALINFGKINFSCPAKRAE
jgi:hypothetical protein